MLIGIGSAKKDTSHIFRGMSSTLMGLVSLSKIRYKISIIIKISLPMPFPPLILKSLSLSEDVDLYIKKCRAAYLLQSFKLDDLEGESVSRSSSHPLQQGGGPHTAKCTGRLEPTCREASFRLVQNSLLDWRRCTNRSGTAVMRCCTIPAEDWEIHPSSQLATPGRSNACSRALKPQPF